MCLSNEDRFLDFRKVGSSIGKASKAVCDCGMKLDGESGRLPADDTKAGISRGSCLFGSSQ